MFCSRKRSTKSSSRGGGGGDGPSSRSGQGSSSSKAQPGTSTLSPFTGRATRSQGTTTATTNTPTATTTPSARVETATPMTKAPPASRAAHIPKGNPYLVMAPPLLLLHGLVDVIISICLWCFVGSVLWCSHSFSIQFACYLTVLGLYPYAAGTKFDQYKMMHKTWKMTETLVHMGTHLSVLCEGYLMNTNMTGFKWFSKIFASKCFGR